MLIPEHITMLMARLEQQGHQAWVVGGCVRDWLLGMAPHDWDMCTNATPEEMKAIFHDYPLILAGEKHGTVAVGLGAQPVEITTFRTEGAYCDARHPAWVRFERHIEADLSRRDFTIGAMAYHPERGLCDPFGGQEDLKNRILRAVGQPEQRFTEDGLRILRGIRFAARFGLKPEKNTLAAMTSLAPTLANQAKERVLSELCGFLPAASAEDMLTFAPILTAAIPALAPMVGFRQQNPNHKYDVYTHSAHVVAGVPKELAARWAALLHDVAKPHCFSVDSGGIGHFYGHARLGAEMADEILRTLRSPNALRERVTTLIAHHSITRDIGLPETDKPLRRLLRRLGEDALWQLLALDRADDGGKGTAADEEFYDAFGGRIRKILEEKPCLTVAGLDIDGHELMAMGIPQGKLLGEFLNRLLDEVTDGMINNENKALRARVLELMEERYVQREANDRGTPGSENA